MAKKQSTSMDRGKVRILYVELEGNNASLQDGIRTLADAMAAPIVVPATRRIESTTRALPQGDADSDTLFNSPIDEDPLEETEDSSPAADQSRRRRGDGPKRDRNASLSLNKDLDDRPHGKTGLKEFYAEKQPKNQQEQITVFIYYCRHVLEMDRITMDDVFTCFKRVGIRIPGDLAQSTRNTANSQGWVDANSLDDLRVTTSGENLVEHDLPRAPK